MLPAGKYYVGDPCYVIQGENYKRWDDFIDHYFEIEGCKNGVYTTWEGKQLFAANTMYGDGVYQDQKQNSYPVDAGMIAAVPFELIDMHENVKFGQVIEFNEPFYASRQDGVIYIGNVVIDTN